MMFILFGVATIVLLFGGCASTPPEKKSDNPTAQRLIGKTQEAILKCAGRPFKEVPYGHGLVLRYYKEAPILEESRSFLKGSTPGEHHGCWASLLIEKEEVTGVEFRTVPQGAGTEEDDECEAIFATCLQ